jgi:hypothetical protein
VLALLISWVPYMASPRETLYLRYIACGDLVIAYILMCILTIKTYSPTFQYASIFASGGNCPTYVHRGCNSNPNNNWASVGCRSIAPLNDTKLSTLVHNGEVGLSYVSLTYAGCIGIYAFIFIIGKYAVWRVKTKGAASGWTVNEQGLKAYDPDQTEKMALATAIVAFLSILALAAAMIPIHVIGETVPSKFTFVDAMGPYTYYYGGQNSLYNGPGNATTWSECFEVAGPTSKSGFFSIWWKMRSDVIAHALALV